MEDKYLTPVVVEFESDYRNGKYYRIGTDYELNDRIYRKLTGPRGVDLNDKEFEILIHNNNQLLKIKRELI